MTIKGVTRLPGHTLDTFTDLDGHRSRSPATTSEGQQPIRLDPSATSSYQRVSAPPP